MTWVTINMPDKKKRNQRTNGQKTIEVYYASAFITDELLRLSISRKDELNAI